MYETFKNRMSYQGKNMGEILRVQSNMVIEQTWYNDPNYRQVYVVKVNSGLPQITENLELIDVKFNIKSYQAITSDEVAYMLQFRHGEEKRHPEINIGSYVYMEDEDGKWKWWLLVHLDERPQFRQWQILECNYELKWVYEGKIHNTLSVQRVQQSYNSGSWDGDRLTFVDNVTSVWLPTNADTLTITYNKRFIISDKRRYPPIVYTVSKLEDTQPMGLTKLKFTQETFNPTVDNAELGICNYYDSHIIETDIPNTPDTPDVEGDVVVEEIKNIDITYNGTKPTVKVGGSEKIFTAQLPEDYSFDISWSVIDGDKIYGDSFENYTQVFGDYTIITEDRMMKLKVARNYNLVGKILIIKAKSANNDLGQIQVEVIG
jgi:hypothetical protein